MKCTTATTEREVRITQRYPHEIHQWVWAHARENERSYNGQILFLLRGLMKKERAAKSSKETSREQA